MEKMLSRRELLSFRSHKADKTNIQQIPADTQNDLISTPPMQTRGRFIQTLGIITGTLLTASFLGTKNSLANQQIQEPQRNIQPTANKPDQITSNPANAQTQETEEKTTHFDTTKESIVLNTAWTGVRMLTDKLHIPFGNAQFEEHKKEAFFDKSAKTLLFEGAIVAPTLEESFFRYVPSKILDALGIGETAWSVGVPVSTAFALLHNLTLDPESKKFGFSKRIPAGQFLFGMYFWKMMRERGFSHALLAHSVMNTEQLGVAKLFYKIFPHKAEKEIQRGKSSIEVSEQDVTPKR